MKLPPQKNRKLTDRELEVLESLIDEEGHPLWKIAEGLECDKGNLSRTIKGLESKGLVYHVEAKSSRWRTRSPNMIEHRYFILKTYRNIRFMQGNTWNRMEYHKGKIASDDKKLGLFTKDGINRPRQILINKFQIFSNWLVAVRDENPDMRKDYDATIAPRPRTHQELSAMIWR